MKTTGASGATTGVPASPGHVTRSLAALPRPVFESYVRVYFEDTDAGGIVYHANYLRFFERARTDWLRSLGARHRELERRDGLVFVVREMHLDYATPARLDDRLRIDVRLLEARRATMRLAQVASDADSGAVRVSATLRIAAIDPATGRPVGLPRWLMEKVREE